MKRVIIIIVGILLVFAGAFVYLFSYGDWTELASTGGNAEDSWYHADDVEKNFSIDGLNFKDYDLGYNKWKLQVDNVLDHGRYSLAFAEGDIFEDSRELDIIYELPEQTADTNGFEQIIDNSIMQQATAFVTEYKEPTAGMIAVSIYGKRRHIMDLLEHIIDEEDIREWNEKLN